MIREESKIAKRFRNGLDFIDEIQAELDKVKLDLREAAYRGDYETVVGIAAWLALKKETIVEEFKGVNNFEEKYGVIQTETIPVATINGVTYRVGKSILQQSRTKD